MGLSVFIGHGHINSAVFGDFQEYLVLIHQIVRQINPTSTAVDFGFHGIPSGFIDILNADFHGCPIGVPAIRGKNGNGKLGVSYFRLLALAFCQVILADHAACIDRTSGTLIGTGAFFRLGRLFRLRGRIRLRRLLRLHRCIRYFPNALCPVRLADGAVRIHRILLAQNRADTGCRFSCRGSGTQIHIGSAGGALGIVIVLGAFLLAKTG